jgi:hypothetical protein
MAVISIKNKTKSGSLLVGNTPAPPTSPVAGYKVWLDASDTATITQSGGAVSQWTDKSANAYAFTQATSSYKPTTAANTQNGKNVLTTGTNDCLVSTAASSVWKFLHNSTSTCFFALKYNVSTYGGHLLCTADSTSKVGMDCFQENTGKFQSVILRGASGTYVVANATSANVLTTNFTYVTLISDATNATAANRSDIRIKQGTAIKNNVQTGAVDNSNPASTLNLFDGLPGANEGIDGQVGEFLIYDSILSAGDILANQQYLANKWGV